MKDEIILYQSEKLSQRVEVMVKGETVWLNKEQMGFLFGRDRTVISRHINNIFKEGELQKEEVCAFFAHTTHHGFIKGKRQTKYLEFYNLDVIISIEYRVKSKQGTQFRIWANKILKDYLLKGYSLNQRMNRIENNVQNLAEKVENIDLQIQSNLPPNQGIFYNEQFFDAHKLVSDIIRTANKSIILIDNYIDDTVLNLFIKRKKKVSTTIYTDTISKMLRQDLKKFNEQYEPIEIKNLKTSHDRFLIIDKKSIYHIGASLKDLGKKWFAFSKLELDPVEMVVKLEEKKIES